MFSAALGGGTWSGGENTQWLTELTFQRVSAPALNCHRLMNTGNSGCEAYLQPAMAEIDVEGGGCQLHQIPESTESLVRAEAAERCRYSV